MIHRLISSFSFKPFDDVTLDRNFEWRNTATQCEELPRNVTRHWCVFSSYCIDTSYIIYTYCIDYYSNQSIPRLLLFALLFFSQAEQDNLKFTGAHVPF